LFVHPSPLKPETKVPSKKNTSPTIDVDIKRIMSEFLLFLIIKNKGNHSINEEKEYPCEIFLGIEGGNIMKKRTGLFLSFLLLFSFALPAVAETENKQALISLMVVLTSVTLISDMMKKIGGQMIDAVQKIGIIQEKAPVNLANPPSLIVEWPEYKKISQWDIKRVIGFPSNAKNHKLDVEMIDTS
jgi:hypothetical protein